jgi:alpha-N-acetylglucosaminidase
MKRLICLTFIGILTIFGCAAEQNTPSISDGQESETIAQTEKPLEALPKRADATVTMITDTSQLDLTNVAKAINFGYTTDQTIGSTTFKLTRRNTTVNNVTNTAKADVGTGWGGQSSPKIGPTGDDDALEEILATSIYAGDYDIDITVPNGTYILQFLLYEAWYQTTPRADFTVEGRLIADEYDMWTQQGSSTANASVLTYTVTVTDGTIDIDCLATVGPNNHVSGLIVNSVGDTDAPTPSKATWSSAPSADSISAISMTATTGTDVTGPVEYFFDETSGKNGGTDSGWQKSPDYTDDGLDRNTQYTYTVQMRDLCTRPNVGAVSSAANATTDAIDTDPPAPSTATWASAPSADSQSAISMTATTGTDASGPVEYYFDETSGNPGGTDSGWQRSPNYTDDGLNPNTQYTYTVQMRDSVSPTVNVGTVSPPANARTKAIDTNPPKPSKATWGAAPFAYSSSVTMTATTGTDVTGPVEYFFDETSGNPGGTDSGWQTSPYYTDDGLNPDTQYTYTVQMRDSWRPTPNVGTVSSPASATTTGVINQVQAARGVIKRILPSHEQKFVLEIIPQDNGKDVFELESQGKKIVIRGSSGVTITNGFHYYLKHYGKCQVSWFADQLNVPQPLPTIPSLVRIATPYKYRYNIDYSAYQYTMPFWTWQRWEREIDWMAMNGVNVAMVRVGFEAVWQRTLQDLGFSESEISTFLTGPGYLASLGVVMEGYGGPMPQSWIDSHITLAQKICQRMRELGIDPLLPGFYGSVPKDTTADLYPSADIYEGGTWQGFERPDVLNPEDPLFDTFATSWYQNQEDLYGNAKFFAIDPFHEGSPPSIDLIASAGKIHAAITAVNPDAVWVLMAWEGHPEEDLLAGMVKERSLVLDVTCLHGGEWVNTDGFNGHPWVWAIVNNYGGNTTMYGKLDRLAKDIPDALNSPVSRNMDDIGFYGEGSDNNPILLDLLWEMGWKTSTPNMDDWVQDYLHSRYGVELTDALDAWQLLRKSLYTCNMYYIGGTEPIACARPPAAAEPIVRVSPYGSTFRYYNANKLIEAWGLLLNCSSQLTGVETYEHDLVEVTRQVLAEIGYLLYTKMTEEFNAGDKTAFKISSQQFLDSISDQDELMATKQMWLLGNWIADARSWGTTTAEKDLYEFNARRVLTLWGPYTSEGLHDYTHREWAGLLEDFYKPRWQLWVDDMLGQLDGNPPQNIDYYTWEDKWTKQTNTFSSTPVGNSVTIAQSIYTKYKPLIGSLFVQPGFLDEPTDLDLTNVVKAINFGNTTNQTIGGTTFKASGSNTTVDNVTNTATAAIAAGYSSGTIPIIGSAADDNALEEILATSIFGSDYDIDITVPNGTYKLQILLYETWRQPEPRADFTIEGTLVEDEYSMWNHQEGSLANGSVLTYVVTVTDGNIDITCDATVGTNCHFAGLIVTSVDKDAPTPSTAR